MEVKIVDRDEPRYRTLSPLKSPKQQKSKLKKLHKFATYINVQSIVNRKQLNNQMKSVLVVQVPKQLFQKRKSNFFSLYQSPKSNSQQNTTIDSFFKISNFNNRTSSNYHTNTATIYRQTNDMKQYQQQDYPYSNRNSLRDTRSQHLTAPLMSTSKDFNKGRSTICHVKNTFETTFMIKPLKTLKSKQYQKHKHNQMQMSPKMEAYNPNSTANNQFRNNKIKLPSSIPHEPIKVINQKELIKISRATGSFKYQRFRSQNISKTNYEAVNQKIKLKKLTAKKDLLLAKQEQFAPWNIDLQVYGVENDAFKKSVQ